MKKTGHLHVSIDFFLIKELNKGSFNIFLTDFLYFFIGIIIFENEHIFLEKNKESSCLVKIKKTTMKTETINPKTNHNH